MNQQKNQKNYAQGLEVYSRKEITINPAENIKVQIGI